MEKRETFAQALCDVLVKQKVVSEAEGRALARAFKSSEKENFDDLSSESQEQWYSMFVKFMGGI